MLGVEFDLFRLLSPLSSFSKSPHLPFASGYISGVLFGRDSFVNTILFNN
jgi:hypothetical protein